MASTTKRWSVVATVAVAALATMLFVYLRAGKPPSQVAGVPEPPRGEASTPYRGSHPSQITRPIDTFEYPIPIGSVGPIEPLFAGPQQYPFLCETEESYLGQPVVDNHEGIGVSVYTEDDSGRRTKTIEGYSKDCGLLTRAMYYYNREGTQKFFPLAEAKGDIAKIAINGRQVDFIIRVEIGTINRFIYEIASLKGPGDMPDTPDAQYWNKRLIFHFRGGVGIGRRQGRTRPVELLERQYNELKKGYAVVASSGMRTSTHYDIWLIEDTALRVKRQFQALYGEPLYTVGIGGSGGAIQQYLLGQNRPGLIDAAIALYSYPDMVTQTIHVFDCELLEYFFDVTDSNNEKWKNWENRRWIEGLNANPGGFNKFTFLTGLSQLARGEWPNWPFGNTECVNGWRGLTPLINNPRYTPLASRFAAPIVQQTQWTYWENLRTFYGLDTNGYARTTWDNVGVQYGLSALILNKITPEEFLNLNANIGGWTTQEDMQPERLWRFEGARSTLADALPWSTQNMRLSPDAGKTPAPRTEGDTEAIEAAFRSGQVFAGDISIPIIDLRHYLEPELDMHHSSASFSARLRILQAQGNADHQLIWMTRKPHAPIAEAFDLIDRWMLNMLAASEKTVAANRPPDGEDKCFTKDGMIIAEGPQVWDGAWNGKPPGACMAVYPIYGTSRTVAGAGLGGDVFKCRLQPVENALERGIYGSIDMHPYLSRLKAVFPNGVCDYSASKTQR